MGVKRDHQAMMAGANTSPYLPMFEEFRTELDSHYDRRERIIKASRDITAASKKIIFTLHRIRQLQQPLPLNVVNGNKQYHDALSAQFSAVSADLQELNSHRYARQISGGCQEYIEAATFQHYLTTGKLLSYEDAAAQMQRLDAEGVGVQLSIEDYILGIYDMTGELMKFAITAMATSGELPMIVEEPSPAVDTEVHSVPPTSRSNTRTLLTDMRDVRSALEALDPGSGPFAQEVKKKMEVMQASVEKVEKALYGLIVRGAERPKGWMPDSNDSSRALEVEG